MTAPPEAPAETTGPIPLARTYSTPSPAAPTHAASPQPPLAQPAAPHSRPTPRGKERARWTPATPTTSPPRALPPGGRHRKPEPEPEPHELPVDDAEAGALAAAFALDLTSWDEDNPDRRAVVLARYLPIASNEQLGWDGTGRQRAETALPGQCVRHDDTHVTVDVRVRVTPYQRVHDVVPLFPAMTHEPEGMAVPAAAPAPTAPGWVACDSEWIRLRIPIARNRSGGLAVDLSEESASEAAQPTRGAC